jgi:hypothetical protein
MRDNQTSNYPSCKMRYRLQDYESQIELAFLVIVYYLKMRPVMENWSNKYPWFSFLQKGMAKVSYYGKVYKDFFTIIISEFYSVIILKEKTWESAN